MKAKLLTCFLTASLCSAYSHADAQQWTTNGNDINNTNSGNVGVGTATPENSEGWDRALEIKGGNHAKALITGGSITTGVWSNVSNIFSAPAGGMAGTWTNHPFSILTNRLPRISITNTGNVGIGTNTPENSESWDRVLEIAGPNHAKALVSGGGVISGLYSDSYSPYGAPIGGIVGTWTNHPFSFMTNKLSRMTISNTGNIGIGTISPAYKLHVVGNVRVTDEAENQALALSGNYAILGDEGGDDFISTSNDSHESKVSGSSLVTVIAPNVKISANTTKISGQMTVGNATNFHLSGDYNASIYRGLNVITQSTKKAIYMYSDENYQLLDAYNYNTLTPLPLRISYSGANTLIGNEGFGKTGIGVSNPAEKLDVLGNVKFSGALMPAGTAGTAGQVLTSAGAGAAPVWATASSSSISGGTTGYFPFYSSPTSLAGTSPIFTDGANVGIGTTSLSTPLNVVTGSAGEMMKIQNNTLTGVSGLGFYNNTGNWVGGMGYGNAGTGNYVADRMYITSNRKDIEFSKDLGLASTMLIAATGNVGIATTEPSERLDVVGNIKAGTANPVLIGDGFIRPQTGGDNQTLQVNATKINIGEYNNYTYSAPAALQTIRSGSDGKELFRYSVNTGAGYVAMSQVNSSYFAMNFVQNNISQMFLSPDGKIGMGTTTPAAKLDVAGNIYSSGKVMIGVASPSPTLLSDYSLAVNGSAIFTKAVVKLNANWPDYVFSKNYELPNLANVEKYINENNHLPGVASAQEVEKNGVDLGDNQAVLLKKVEELTLYMIEMDKKMQQVQKENAEMKAENKNIKMELENLKAKN